MARESIGDVRIRKNDSKGTVVRLLVRHHVGRAVLPRRIGFLYCGEPEFSDKNLFGGRSRRCR